MPELWKRFGSHTGAVLGLSVFSAVLLAAVLAPWLAPFAPNEQFREAILLPPFTDPRFVLGTDELGRDMLTRLLYDAQLSLLVGATAVVLALIPGVALGLLAGFYPRLLGTPIMRLMDIILSIPALLLAVAIVAVLGPGLTNTVLAIAIVALPSYVRLTRSAVLAEKDKDYVTAAKMAGAHDGRLMFITLLPNCLAPLLVQASLGFSSAILEAAALGFLGLGVQPPTAEWGAMLSSARDYIDSAWWVVTWPGLAILVTVLAINLVGDGLRDALDPKAWGRR